MSSVKEQFHSQKARVSALSYISPDAQPYVDILRLKSPTARMILSAMESDSSGNKYRIIFRRLPESFGCGSAGIQERARKTGIITWPWSKQERERGVDVHIEVDPNCNVQFVDIQGKPFVPSIERILAHELGHGYAYIGVEIKEEKYPHAAVDYENAIAKELDPAAPIRSKSDHSGGRDMFRKF